MLSIFKTRKLLHENPQDILANTNTRSSNVSSLVEEKTTTTYRKVHQVSNGIERIHYIPFKRRHSTPILFQHGMWHGAWCWQLWQEWFAEQGYESIAYSLPGHGLSPEQRPIAECTLSYYLAFLKSEIDRLEVSPVLVGHSMGGALAQWYLKYVGDLAGVVFAASWTSHDIFRDSIINALKLDPWGWFHIMRQGPSAQFRTTELVEKWFLSPGSAISPQILKTKLGPESEVVLFQHRPKHWSPKQNHQTPCLWLAPTDDAIINFSDAKRSAEFYGAEFQGIVNANHNLMLEENWELTAKKLELWANEIDTLEDYQSVRLAAS